MRRRRAGNKASAVPSAMIPPPIQSQTTIGLICTRSVTAPVSVGDETSVR